MFDFKEFSNGVTIELLWLKIVFVAKVYVGTFPTYQNRLNYRT